MCATSVGESAGVAARTARGDGVGPEKDSFLRGFTWRMYGSVQSPAHPSSCPATTPSTGEWAKWQEGKDGKVSSGAHFK